ncbi:MAG: hypothetical protein QM813_12395, partial [Verrucomicrobiota bacterium]
MEKPRKNDLRQRAGACWILIPSEAMVARGRHHQQRRGPEKRHRAQPDGGVRRPDKSKRLYPGYVLPLLTLAIR